MYTKVVFTLNEDGHIDPSRIHGLCLDQFPKPVQASRCREIRGIIQDGITVQKNRVKRRRLRIVALVKAGGLAIE